MVRPRKEVSASWDQSQGREEELRGEEELQDWKTVKEEHKTECPMRRTREEGRESRSGRQRR